MAGSPDGQVALITGSGKRRVGNAVALALLGAAKLLGYFEFHWSEDILAYLLAALLVVVGVEMVLNFLLDLYRPRVPGVAGRFSYDSRLLNLIASPERVGHSIAEAINYQFGFEVSGTWFFQLLRRACLPLIIGGAVMLWLLTGVVVVEEGRQCVVLRWGKPDPSRRVLMPRRAPYLLWPWPIDKTQQFDTGKMHEVVLGLGAESDHEDEGEEQERVFLWSQAHGEQAEMDTLVAKPADPTAKVGRDGGVPAVSVIKLIVGVYYRIDDPYRYGYAFVDAPKLLQAVAHREMVRYAASATLDEKLSGEGGANRPQGIMSFGRGNAEKDLLARISAEAEALDLGVAIQRVQILGCHPPPGAAAAFEEVISAERERDQMRHAAQADARKVLAEVAGDPGEAQVLAQLISFMQDWENLLNVRKTGGSLDRAIDGGVEAANNRIEKLNEEIDKERLMGRTKTAQATRPEQLLAGQKQHLALLEACRKSPATFPLDKEFARARDEVDRAFAAVGGSAATEVARARAYRWQKEFKERSRAESFPVQLQALGAAPAVFVADKRLEALTRGLASTKKYLLGIDSKRVEFRVNLEQSPAVFGDIPLGKQGK
ncbi:hypothetical protein LCGC14_1981570 [marine sediment metagenome]|uniref:Band 7 domain-containing protein n=1 Tax=marine sediment metagenome TaxID=412755 RepID=A0A0F9F912_9ZZZZ